VFKLTRPLKNCFGVDEFLFRALGEGRVIQRKSFQLLVLSAIAIAITGGSVLIASARRSSIRSEFLGASAPTAAAPSAVPVTIERLDPAINLLVPEKPVLEKVATGYKWTEGPLWIPDGYLLFAEIPSNSIRKWTPGAGVSIFMQPSGYKGSAPFTGPEPGSNGNTLDVRGRLTVAGHAQRDVWRLEQINPKAQVTLLADSYQGKRLNSPNDLVYSSDGSLYFTDPPY
jgi:gluconolactonase